MDLAENTRAIHPIKQYTAWRVLSRHILLPHVTVVFADLPQASGPDSASNRLCVVRCVSEACGHPQQAHSARGARNWPLSGMLFSGRFLH